MECRASETETVVALAATLDSLRTLLSDSVNLPPVRVLQSEAIAPTALQEVFSAMDQAWERTVCSVLSPSVVVEIDRLLNSSSPDLLRILQREDHENSHSDLIAWLLSPSKAPNVARHALLQLLELIAPVPSPERTAWQTAIDEALARGLVSVYREHPIGDTFSIDDNRRRLDILVSGPGFLIVIENKVWSEEHTTQTEA